MAQPRALAPVLALALVACGAAPVTTPASPPAPAKAAEGGRCLATTARRRPVGWIESGKIVVAVKDGQPTSFEAKDATGEVVASKAAPGDGEAARALLVTLTCQLGGLVAAFEGEPPNRGAATATLTVLKPGAPDERADVATMCKPPEGLPAGVDESQRVRIAFEVYQESLTTPKWRAWLVDLLDASRKASDAAARLSLKKARSDELKAAAAAAKIAGACWFAEGIAQPPPTPPAH